MKVYNKREEYWVHIRGKRQQLQKYKWNNLRYEHGSAKTGTYVLELRPGIRVGIIEQVKVSGEATDFDVKILSNNWDDSTSGYDIYEVATWTNNDRLLYDQNVDAYYISGVKTRKKELEALKRDNTNEELPCLAMIVDVTTGDMTTMEAELIVEGDFPPDDKRMTLSLRAHPKY